MTQANITPDSIIAEPERATERAFDAKGRVVAADMSDREIAEETLILLRAFGDVLSTVGKSPFAAMLPPGMMPDLSSLDK